MNLADGSPPPLLRVRSGWLTWLALAAFADHVPGKWTKLHRHGRLSVWRLEAGN